MNTIKANNIPSRLPWEVIFFKTPLEPWGRHVIRGPDAPGGIAVTIGGLDETEEANAKFIARACNSHDALVDAAKKLLARESELTGAHDWLEYRALEAAVKLATGPVTVVTAS